jgi:hypothetical protein
VDKQRTYRHQERKSLSRASLCRAKQLPRGKLSQLRNNREAGAYIAPSKSMWDGCALNLGHLAPACCHQSCDRRSHTRTRTSENTRTQVQLSRSDDDRAHTAAGRSADGQLRKLRCGRHLDLVVLWRELSGQRASLGRNMVRGVLSKCTSKQVSENLTAVPLTLASRLVCGHSAAESRAPPTYAHRDDEPTEATTRNQSHSIVTNTRNINSA